jgi:hypothetical protein
VSTAIATVTGVTGFGIASFLTWRDERRKNEESRAKIDALRIEYSSRPLTPIQKRDEVDKFIASGKELYRRLLSLKDEPSSIAGNEWLIQVFKSGRTYLWVSDNTALDIITLSESEPKPVAYKLNPYSGPTRDLELSRIASAIGGRIKTLQKMRNAISD